MDHAQLLGTYLFSTGEPATRQELSSFLKLTEEEVNAAIGVCKERVGVLGLTLVDDGKQIELRTAPEASSLVEEIRKDEFSRDIGKAGIETLSILLYKGAQSRSEIDYIRGVNSSHILRALSMRGLLRRVPHPKDERSFLYEPTGELLAHLGVSSVDALPDFQSVKAELEALEKIEESSEEKND